VAAAGVAMVLLAWFIPGVADVLVLDRERACSGELWRWFTHPWVHFSVGHWVVDLACFLGLAWLADRAGIQAGWRWVLGVIAVSALTGMTCLWLDPQLERLGGLSGLNVAMAVWIGGAAWRRGERTLAAALLGGLAIKLVGERLGAFGVVRFDQAGVESSHLSHWVAAAWAIGVGASSKFEGSSFKVTWL
jgi:membrane associated rhomboid family serine protease